MSWRGQATQIVCGGFAPRLAARLPAGMLGGPAGGRTKSLVRYQGRGNQVVDTWRPGGGLSQRRPGGAEEGPDGAVGKAAPRLRDLGPVLVDGKGRQARPANPIPIRNTTLRGCCWSELDRRVRGGRARGLRGSWGGLPRGCRPLTHRALVLHQPGRATPAHRAIAEHLAASFTEAASMDGGNSGGECGAPRGEGRAEFTASGVPREAFQPGDLALAPISAPARPPRPLFSPSGITPMQNRRAAAAARHRQPAPP